MEVVEFSHLINEGTIFVYASTILAEILIDRAVLGLIFQ